MSHPHKADRPANRLLDIQVEEVSLVDRAANEHRFLIVKRSDTPMADTQDAVVDDAAPDEGAAATTDPDTEPAAAIDPLLAHAVTALEGLTSTVELLGSLGAHTADPRLAPLASELKATAEALLARAGVPASGDGGADEIDGADEGAPAEDASFEANLASARAALAQLASLTAAAKPEAAPSPAPAPALPEQLTASLEAMTASFRALAETVKEQQQRLARVEKQFGLPNSTSTERVRKAEPEEVGWPMDLNHPMDRESVDKTVSFHDL